MRTYNIISPLIDGIISDDFLYFEGIKRPMEVFALRDGKIITENDIGILEKYFNDIYNLFLRKLSSFALFEQKTDDEIIKMQALFQELIKIRKLIENK